MTRQAIQTKYLPPTNHRGARIKAQAGAGTKVYSWDHALGSEANHEKAAKAFAEGLDWLEGNTLHGGCLADGSYCWVILPAS